MKYYTMKECLDECGDDDVPFIECGFNDGTKLTKKEILTRDGFLTPILTPKFAISDQWQIKRAEPVVLSAEEMMCRLDIEPDGLASRKWAAQYGEAMDKNGQLREWLRPEQVELREAVKNWAENGQDLTGTNYRMLVSAYLNLKQPGG